METAGENTADAYEVAYDTLSHDLRRDEKLRERGVKTQGWPSKRIRDKNVYVGHEDQVGQNFQLRDNFRVKIVTRGNGQL
eukprot:4022364-Karenia_brevis.AAC.1